jgi:hypothetical protein
MLEIVLLANWRSNPRWEEGFYFYIDSYHLASSSTNHRHAARDVEGI